MQKKRAEDGEILSDSNSENEAPKKKRGRKKREREESSDSEPEYDSDGNLKKKRGRYVRVMFGILTRHKDKLNYQLFHINYQFERIFFLFLKRSRRRKGGKIKKKPKDDGLSAKQRMKIKSQAMVDSDSSDSSGPSRLRISPG